MDLFYIRLIFYFIIINVVFTLKNDFYPVIQRNRRFFQPLKFSSLTSYVRSSNNSQSLSAYNNKLLSSDNDEMTFISPFTPIFPPCVALLDYFYDVADNFTNCAITNSLPPQVCTKCADYYVALEQAYFRLKDSSDVVTQDGKPCDKIIFGMYETVYVENLYGVLTEDVWADSRCTECLEFVISPTSSSRNYRLNNKTAKFHELHDQLYKCIQDEAGTIDSTKITEKNASLVCGQCWKEYENINLYYETAIMSQLDFCVDVVSAINDTIKLWRNVLGCSLPRLPTQRSEAVSVALIALAMVALTVLFYLGSFMHGSRRKRRVKKYRSWYTSYGALGPSVNDDVVEEYIEERQRLLSSSSRARRTHAERSPLLFAGGRRVISYSQLPPSNLG